jgi:hypothetical protein
MKDFEASTKGGWLPPILSLTCWIFSIPCALRALSLWERKSPLAVYKVLSAGYIVGSILGFLAAAPNLNARLGLAFQLFTVGGALLVSVLSRSGTFFKNYLRTVLMGSPFILAWLSCVFLAPTPDFPVRALQMDGGYALEPIEGAIVVFVMALIIPIMCVIQKYDEKMKEQIQVPILSPKWFVGANTGFALTIALFALAVGDWGLPTVLRFIGFTVLYSAVLAGLAVAHKRFRHYFYAAHMTLA